MNVTQEYYMKAKKYRSYVLYQRTSAIHSDSSSHMLILTTRSLQSLATVLDYQDTFLFLNVLINIENIKAFKVQSCKHPPVNV